MSTLTGRPKTALLVVDVQNQVVDGAYQRDDVVANVVTLVDKARRGGVPVVWVQHSNDEMAPGSPAWEFVPELKPLDEEALVHKRYPDAFDETSLEEVLAGLSAGRLVVAGASTDQCIRATLHGAVVRGYDAILVSDAHTTEDLSDYGAPKPDVVVAFTNLYWENHEAPGREAGIVATAEVAFGLAPA